MQDYREERQVIAEGIAIEAGAVEKCEFHDDCILAKEDLDANEKAYKLAAFRLKRGDFTQFSSQSELTDLIKSVIDHACDSCYSCERF